MPVPTHNNNNNHNNSHNHNSNRLDAATRAALQSLIEHGPPDARDDPARDARLFQVLRDALLGNAQNERELRLQGRVHACAMMMDCPRFRHRLDDHHHDHDDDGAPSPCFTVRSRRTFAIAFRGFSPDAVRLTVGGVEHRARITAKLLDDPVHPHVGALVQVRCDALAWFHFELYAPPYRLRRPTTTTTTTSAP
jgi:hypothetical protein